MDVAENPPSAPATVPPEDNAELGEEDVCKICRCGEEEGPLLRPCNCVGSIEYVHNDCMMAWVNHSNQTSCPV